MFSPHDGSRGMKVIPMDGQRISVPASTATFPLKSTHRGDICDGPSISSSDADALEKRAGVLLGQVGA